jgi:hypothetical protein
MPRNARGVAGAGSASYQRAFVEDVVVRQKTLHRDPDACASVEKHRGVVKWTSRTYAPEKDRPRASRCVPVSRANSERARSAASITPVTEDRVPVAVSDDRRFRKDRQIGSSRLGLPEGFPNPGDVSGNVSGNGFDLAERDAKAHA